MKQQSTDRKIGIAGSVFMILIAITMICWGFYALLHCAIEVYKCKVHSLCEDVPSLVYADPVSQIIFLVVMIVMPLVVVVVNLRIIKMS